MAVNSRFSDPYGRPTTGYGFGRGSGSTSGRGAYPTFGPQAAGPFRPYIPGNTQGSTNRNDYPSFIPVTSNTQAPTTNQTPTSTLSASTETIVDKARQEASFRNALEMLGRRNITDAARARVGTRMAIDQILRNAYGSSQGIRDELSASGLGYSPRFAGRAQRALTQQTAADIAAQESSFRNAIAGLAANLQAEEGAMAVQMADLDIDENLDAVNLALAQMMEQGVYNEKGAR